MCMSHVDSVTLIDLERVDPKFAFLVGRIVGLYRRL